MKVWPAAVVLAALVVVRDGRLRIVAAGLALTAAIAAAVAAFGDVRNLTGFLSAQGARGMQLEAPLSTPGVWQAITGSSGAYFFEDEVMLEAQQRGIEANPGYDFYNLNIDAGSMWTRRKVAAMIAAESGTDVGSDDEHSGAAAAVGARRSR